MIDRTELTTDAARQGETGHGVRWVLVASCSLVCVVMLIVIVFASR